MLFLFPLGYVYVRVLVCHQDHCLKCGIRSRSVAKSRKSGHQLCRDCMYDYRYLRVPPPVPAPPPTLFGRTQSSSSHLTEKERMGIIVMRKLGFSSRATADRIGCR